MIKRLFSSQLRINMVSGTVATAINAVVMVIAYPVYLHFLGYEKYVVWLILATVLTFQNAVIASHLLPYIAFLSVCVMFVQVLNAAISGLGRMDLANYILSGGRVVTVSTSSILLWLGNGIESLLIGNTLSYIFVGGASVFVIRKTVNIRLLRLDNLDTQRCKRVLRFGGGVFGGSLVSMFLHPFNKLMLARYAGVSSIPIYEIAFNGSMQVRALIETGLRALMPAISRIGATITVYAKHRISQINRRAMRLIFLFGIPTCGGLIIFLTPLLKFWLKQRFVDELPIAFRIMLISTFLSLLGVPAYYTFLGLGMVRYTLISHIILSGVSALIILTMVFIWHTISVETVSWSILTATALTTLYLNWQNKRRM